MGSEKSLILTYRNSYRQKNHKYPHHHTKYVPTKSQATEQEEGGGSTTKEDSDVKLSEGLRALFGKRKYAKKREIGRAHLMRYLCGKGEITEVSLLHVDIEVSLIIFTMPMDHIRYV